MRRLKPLLGVQEHVSAMPRRLTKDHPCLDALELHRLGAFTEGYVTSFDFMASCLGLQSLQTARQWVEMAFPRFQGRPVPPVRMRVLWTNCRFGGQRPWLICSQCGQRRLKYYTRGHHHGCRDCMGLGYASSNRTKEARWRDKAQHLRCVLNGSWKERELFGAMPERPYGMRRATYLVTGLR